MTWLKNKEKYIRLTVLVSISCYAYYNIAYNIQQSDFFLLLINYALAFISFASIYTKFKTDTKLLLILMLVFRLIFFFSIPVLSQDFYRFIWDGHLIINGYNPFLSSPVELMQKNAAPFDLADVLYSQLTDLSVSNHSNYPPVSQFLYAISAWLSPSNVFGSLLFLKAVLIVSDLIIFYIAKPILKYFNLPVYLVFLYLLNPLLIVEGVGNLHFEPLMVAFVLAGVLLWLRQNQSYAGIMLGLGVATKLLPLLLIPFFVKSDQKFDLKAFFNKAYIKLTLMALSVSLISFLPFITNQSLFDYINTISLWFNTFEFNASIYYIFRWLGYQFMGWNMIAYFGKGLAFISILILVYLALISTASRRKQIYAMMMALLIYFFLATTVHPWYLILPLSLCFMTKNAYPVLIWSFTVIFSYHAYQPDEIKENTFWLLAEYLPVFIYMIYKFISYGCHNKNIS